MTELKNESTKDKFNRYRYSIRLEWQETEHNEKKKKGRDNKDIWIKKDNKTQRRSKSVKTWLKKKIEEDEENKEKW